MIELFFSYSHKDESYRDELEKHLTILKRTKVINAWHDRRITAGQELHSTIDQHLLQSDIVLLLVSSDFLASDYCYDTEMLTAMQMHLKGIAVVIPVILRPCDWHDSPFGKLLATPIDGKAVSSFASHDEAYLQITTAIKNAIHGLASGNKIAPSASPRVARGSGSRFSQLKQTITLTDQDIDDFLEATFEYMFQYFERSLQQLQQELPQYTSRLKRIDSDTFTAQLYSSGHSAAEGMVFMGGMVMSGSNSINYSNRISSSKNSLNDSLTVSQTEQGLVFKALGFGLQFGSQSNMDMKAAADYYWLRFISIIERRR